jgi:hypothetical protein
MFIEKDVEWTRSPVGNSSETYESGRICDKERHLRIREFVCRRFEEFLAQLGFAHAKVRSRFMTDESRELLERDLIVVVRPSDFLLAVVVV